MLYILEGCDGAGKTTLAKKLAPVLDAKIIHCNTQTPNTEGFFQQIIYASTKQNIIADRFCYGQFVYQNPEERPMRYESGEYDPWAATPKPEDTELTAEFLSNRALYRTEVRLLEAQAKVIFVDADTKTIMDRLIYRGETTGIPVDTIRERYKQVFKQSLLPITYWKT